MNRQGKVMLAAAVTAVVLLGIGGMELWRRHAAVSSDGTEEAARGIRPRLRLPGAPMALARASAESELIAMEALKLAADTARQQGAQALLVHRHGHRVYEYLAPGRSDAAVVDGGELVPALLALSVGPLVDTRRLEPDAAIAGIREAMRAGERGVAPGAPPAILLQDLDGSIANTISTRLWVPLGAADAQLWGTGDAALRLDCCAAARLEDWMRIADLLLQQGTYQGERVVSPDWIRRLLDADASGHRHPVWLQQQRPWTGDEPPAARDVYWFDLGSDARIWLIPRRGLTILHWAKGSSARDTLIPNIILRGLQDQAPAVSGAAELNDLVPGH